MVCKFVAQEPTCVRGWGRIVSQEGGRCNCSHRLRWLEALIDWGQSIYQDGRAIVPNGSGGRASGVVLVFSAVGLSGCGGFRC